MVLFGVRRIACRASRLAASDESRDLPGRLSLPVESSTPNLITTVHHAVLKCGLYGDAADLAASGTSRDEEARRLATIWFRQRIDGHLSVIVFRVLRRFCELAIPQLEACEPSVVDGSSAWEPSEQRASDC